MPQMACATTATATSLRPCRKPSANGPGECGGAHRKGEQDQRRGHGEGEPRRKAAQKAVAAQNAEGKADLAGGWPRKKLAKRDEVCIGGLVEPFAAVNELVAEITEMRDRAAERRQPQLQKYRKDFGGRVRWTSLLIGLHGHTTSVFRSFAGEFPNRTFAECKPLFAQTWSLCGVFAPKRSSRCTREVR